MDDENEQLNQGMDANEQLNNQGMFEGSDLEQGQEIAKDVAGSVYEKGSNATRRAVNTGRDAISKVRERKAEKKEAEGDRDKNLEKVKKDADKRKKEIKKRKIKGAKTQAKGKKAQLKGKKQQFKGKQMERAGQGLKNAGRQTRIQAKTIRGAATSADAIPYVGPVISVAIKAAATAVDIAGMGMERSGQKMQNSGQKMIKRGMHNEKRGKILQQKGKDIGSKADSNSNLSVPNAPRIPGIGSIIAEAKRDKVSIFRLIMATPVLKWLFIGMIIIMLFMVIFSSGSREKEGTYNENDNGNVPYVVSNQVTSKISIETDEFGNLSYSFLGESGNKMNLDEAIDAALKTLKDNDSNAYGDLGNTDEERKAFLKKLILAEIATQYPNLDTTGSGDIDLPEASNVGSSSTGTSVRTVSVEDMSLDEKIYQMLMVGVTLSDANAYSDSKYGGYFFFGGSNYDNLTAMGSEYKVAPFVATDDEGGQVTRVASGTPSAKSYGDSQDYDKLRADEISKTNLLLSKGVNLNLGPVNDTVSSGAIYDAERCYSSDADITNKCVKTVLEARNSVIVNGAHIGSALKHYPGYPSESANSDFAKCIDNSPESQVNASANNFEEGIRYGAQSVMVSNVIYSKVDNNYPASLSPTIISKLRRNFNGVIMTDGLDAAATSEYSDRYKRAIIAGNDMILLNEGNASTAFSQIKSAVQNGEISEDRINESVLRILTMKRNLGILKNINNTPNPVDNEDTSSSNSENSAQVSNESIDGRIIIKRKDDSGNTAVLEYKDEATFNSMIASGDPNVMKYYTLKKNVGGASSSSSGSADYSGSDNEEIVWNFLRSKGLSEICTAAAMGNIQAESGFDPGVEEHGSGIGFGLAQWSFGRRTQVEQYAADKGKPASDINTQLDFLWMEMDPNADRGSYANLQWGGGGYGWDGASIFAMFTGMTDIDSATTLYCRAFERAGVEVLDRRIKNARDIYARHAGSSVPSSQTNTNNSNSSSSTNSSSTSSSTSSSNNASTSSVANFDNFLFIGDSRYNGIRDSLSALGSNVSVCAVDSSNPSQWVPVTQSKSGTVISTPITLPDTASGVSVMLGVNNTSQVSELKQVLNNLHTNYPNAKIYFNSIYHVSQNYSYGDANSLNASIDAMNAQMQSYCGSTEWLEYIDVTTGLNDADGYLMNADAAGLHLQGEGQTKLVNNIKGAITGAGPLVSSDTSGSNVVNNSGSAYMLVVASYTSQNVKVVDSYTYSNTNAVSTGSGSSHPTTQHSATPGDTVVEDITTTRFTTTNLDYQAVLKDYTLYFDFLWAVYISSRDKVVTQKLADMALNSNIEITLYQEEKNTVNTSTANAPQITRTQLDGTTAYVDYFNTVRTTTVRTQVVTSKACVTEADVWFLKYTNQAANYSEYTSKANEVIEEKTSDDSDLMKLLREKDRMDNLKDSTYLVHRMIKDNAKVSHLYDIYVYIVQKAQKSKTTHNSISEIINVGSFDISTFVPVRGIGSGDGAKGGEEVPESGEGYSSVFKVGTRTYKNYKQGQGSWCNNSLAGFPGDTLAQCGCAINAITVILTGYGIDMTPGDVNEYAKSNPPYESCHGVTLSNLLGKNVTYHSSGNFKQMIIDQLKAGKPCLVRTSAYSSSHYICILAISDDGTQVYVSDVGGIYPTSDRNGWQPLSFLDRINMEIYTIDD